MTDSHSSTPAATQPIDPAKFDKKNLRFEPCIMSTFGDSKTPYGRSKINYANPALGGALQPFILKGPPLSCYGVSDNVDDKSKEITGHSVCLNLPKDENHPFVKAVLSFYEACCEYLATNAEQCGLNPENVNSVASAKVIMKCPAEFPKGKETKKIDRTKPRRMYTKLVEYKATETRAAKMVTIFDNGQSFNVATGKMESQIDPLSVRSNVEIIPSVLFDSIYLGSKPSIQVKLPRAVVTRELVANAVAALDEDVGIYMKSLGLGTGEIAAGDVSQQQDPADML
jgi:hypothetical protein